MFCIKSDKSPNERLWLLEYGPDHPLHKLKYTWTMEWTKATTYASKEAAEARGNELNVGDFIIEKAYVPK
jgi:hypothetical protein